MKQISLQTGYLKRIHVNQHKIKANTKNGTEDPVITVKVNKSKVFAKANYYANSIDIEGESRIVYSKKPLNCGARVWIETKAAVVLHVKN